MRARAPNVGWTVARWGIVVLVMCRANIAFGDGPVSAYWRFEGGSLTDSVSHNVATAMGSPASASFPADVPVTPIPATGQSNSNSYDLRRSSSQWLLVPDNPSLAAAVAFTIEAWVKLRTLGDVNQPTTGSTLVQRKGLGGLADNQTDYAFYAQAADRAAANPGNVCGNTGSPQSYTGRELVLELGNGSTFTSIVSHISFGTQDANEWHFISASYDGVNAVFTIDGQEEIIPCNASRISPTDGIRRDVTIGAKTNSSGAVVRLFDGQMDELRITQAALSKFAMLKAVPPTVTWDAACTQATVTTACTPSASVWITDCPPADICSFGCFCQAQSHPCSAQGSLQAQITPHDRTSLGYDDGSSLPLVVPSCTLAPLAVPALGTGRSGVLILAAMLAMLGTLYTLRSRSRD